MAVGIAPPAVVGYDGKKLRPLIDKFIYPTREDRIIADQRRGVGWPGIKQCGFIPFAVTANLRPVYQPEDVDPDRKSTRLNSSHVAIYYAVYCLKKKEP